MRFEQAFEQQKQVLMRERGALWVKGEIKDIRPGRYPVLCENVIKGKMDPELYDNVEEAPKAAGLLKIIERLIPVTIGIGWAKGLKNNVRMKIDGKEVLVMDNHNFAAPFIMEAFHRGIIGPKSRMAHIDGHPDFSGWLWTSDFDHKVYAGLRTDDEKFRYVVEHTTINNWQCGPLLLSGIVDEGAWRWYFIHPVNHTWYSQNSSFGGHYNKYNILSQSRTGRNDIIDIDIDFLYPLDRSLSGDEKDDVLKGKIPPQIRMKLFEVARLARQAKVITIATSPCYISQPRAIEYVKTLLNDIHID